MWLFPQLSRAVPYRCWAPGLLFADALLTKTKLKRKRAELFDFFPALLHVLDISLW